MKSVLAAFEAAFIFISDWHCSSDILTPYQERLHPATSIYIDRSTSILKVLSELMRR